MFSRGPWLYIRLESNGQTGYIPRIICSLYNKHIISNEKIYSQHNRTDHLSVSSSDSTPNKDELDLTVLPKLNDKHFIRPYKKHNPQPMNRYLSHSSTVINDQPKAKKRFVQTNLIERERRNTCILTQPLSKNTLVNSSKDRRLTMNSINWPTSNSDFVGIHQMNDTATKTMINNGGISIQRDTDSSSTQDSGYSESTPYYLVQQQTTPDTEQISTVANSSKVMNII